MNITTNMIHNILRVYPSSFPFSMKKQPSILKEKLKKRKKKDDPKCGCGRSAPDNIECVCGRLSIIV